MWSLYHRVSLCVHCGLFLKRCCVKNNKEERFFRVGCFVFLRIPRPTSFGCFSPILTSQGSGKKINTREVFDSISHKSNVSEVKHKRVGLGAYLIFECSMPVPFVKRNHYFQWLSMSGLDNMFEKRCILLLFMKLCVYHITGDCGAVSDGPLRNNRGTARVLLHLDKWNHLSVAPQPETQRGQTWIQTPGGLTLSRYCTPWGSEDKYGDLVSYYSV